MEVLRSRASSKRIMPLCRASIKRPGVATLRRRSTGPIRRTSRTIQLTRMVQCRSMAGPLTKTSAPWARSPCKQWHGDPVPEVQVFSLCRTSFKTTNWPQKPIASADSLPRLMAPAAGASLKGLSLVIQPSSYSMPDASRMPSGFSGSVFTWVRASAIKCFL